MRRWSFLERHVGWKTREHFYNKLIFIWFVSVVLFHRFWEKNIEEETTNRMWNSLKKQLLLFSTQCTNLKHNKKQIKKAGDAAPSLQTADCVYKSPRFLKNKNMLKYEVRKTRKKEEHNVSFYQGGAAWCFLSSYNTVTQLFLFLLLWHLSSSAYQRQKNKK